MNSNTLQSNIVKTEVNYVGLSKLLWNTLVWAQISTVHATACQFYLPSSFPGILKECELSVSSVRKVQLQDLSLCNLTTATLFCKAYLMTRQKIENRSHAPFSISQSTSPFYFCFIGCLEVCISFKIATPAFHHFHGTLSEYLCNFIHLHSITGSLILQKKLLTAQDDLKIFW